MRSYVSLRGRREFTLAMRRGSSASTQALTVYVFASKKLHSNPPKVGVVVTKKVGTAVVRNRVRRRCKAILDGLLESAGGQWYVVQCKPAAASTTFATLRVELKDAIARAARPRKNTA